MSKERLDELRSAAHDSYVEWNEHEPLELCNEIDRCHAEIERLQANLTGSESLRNTIMQSSLDAKHNWVKLVAALEKDLHETRTLYENLRVAYHQLQENIAAYQEDRK